MSAMFYVVGVLFFLAALFFNVSNASSMWGFPGGFFAVVAFPVMFVVVPIAVLSAGAIPVYWLLVPSGGFFMWLASRDNDY
ncbi:MAG: hypothetical protein IIC23_08830 [Chloroflexi bacterium]|nr:hypothetical protein [Chloroflexota bacterium]